jgi:hypothetical protein
MKAAIAITEPENLGGRPISPNGAKYRERIKKIKKAIVSMSDMAGHILPSPPGSVVIHIASIATKINATPMPPLGPPK